METNSIVPTLKTRTYWLRVCVCLCVCVMLCCVVLCYVVLCCSVVVCGCVVELRCCIVLCDTRKMCAILVRVRVSCLYVLPLWLQESREENDPIARILFPFTMSSICRSVPKFYKDDVSTKGGGRGAKGEGDIRGKYSLVLKSAAEKCIW